MLLAEAGWIDGLMAAAFLAAVLAILGAVLYARGAKRRAQADRVQRVKAEAERDTAQATDEKLDSMGHDSGPFAPGIDASVLRPSGSGGDDPGGGGE